MAERIVVHPQHRILLSIKRNNQLVHTITRMNLQKTMWSEKGQSLKVNLLSASIFIYMYHSLNDKTVEMGNTGRHRWLWAAEGTQWLLRWGKWVWYKRVTQGTLVVMEMFCIVTIQSQ